MTGHVLEFLGETKLELVPATKQTGNWQTGRDAENILWLVLDREDASVNTIP